MDAGMDGEPGACDLVPVDSPGVLSSMLPQGSTAVRSEAQRPSTPVLRATTPLMLTDADFDAPDCSPRCRVSFDASPIGIDASSSEVTVPEGTEFRIRLRSTGINLRVSLEPPCASSCAEGETLCELDQTCYANRNACN